MIEVLQSFDLKSWLLTGGLGLLLTSTVTILVMLIKQKINQKSDIMQRNILNETTMSTLVTIGTDLSSLFDNVKTLTDGLSSIISIVQSAGDANKITATNLALFVLECFKESNLSDEKKDKLKTLFEKTFFSDSEQFITALKSAKDDSDAALAAANKLIETLQQTVKDKDAQLLAQQTTRKARRV